MSPYVTLHCAATAAADAAQHRSIRRNRDVAAGKRVTAKAGWRGRHGEISISACWRSNGARGVKTRRVISSAAPALLYDIVILAAAYRKNALRDNVP